MSNNNVKRIDVFFYGLFMDKALLEKEQIMAMNPRKAYVEDYVLSIGRRAALTPAENEKAFGIVYSLTYDEIDKLYTQPGLACYRPEALIVVLENGAKIPALTYNLFEVADNEPFNQDYANQLKVLFKSLNFPIRAIRG
ncbi:gamma-glutamylcyclotransferase family protein [Aliikangiella sp. IMCC44359]|uniref:gamma-glutamylcyclotransferase family protein n=1 Tax=Aliikangiella sp. IMCC44359 TaxID=3459125 RepID=UPI00403B10CC